MGRSMNRDAAKTLVFLTFGRGPHVDETLFSLLTLRRFPDDAFRNVAVRVATDQADLFEGHGFEVIPISASTFQEWQGPDRFVHRCKIFTIKHVLEEFGGKLIYVDGDTHFHSPPAPLFDRVGPGRTLMHRVEGRLADSRHEFNHRLGEILAEREAGAPSSIEMARGLATVQWNAGVIGLDTGDMGLLDDVLKLTDYFRSRTFAPVLEQLAFSIILSGRTRLGSSRDIIFHYCTSADRSAFRARLPDLLAESARMPPAERARWLYARRIRPPLALRAKNRLKDVLNVTGVYPARDRFECC